MDLEQLRDILARLQQGQTGLEETLAQLAASGHGPAAFARFDTERLQRTGMEEAIFAPGKRPEHLEALIARSLEQHGAVLVTRVPDLEGQRLVGRFPLLDHNPVARTLRYRAAAPPFPAHGTVAVVTAGTADLPVAEEALVTLEQLGSPALRVIDVGVAGIHRLFERLAELRRASALIVVAGMEGALPGVLGGLVDRPVLAVPTSVGVGAYLGGFSALLTMLNTCAPGVAVLNIDNGFGAACLAHRINRLAASSATPPAEEP